MAYFPVIEPDSRSYDLGRHPVVTQPGWAGGAVRFRTGPIRTGARLQLVFRNLSEAIANDIRTHYATQSSSAIPFGLSSTTMSDSRSWVYAEPPQQEHRSGNLMDVTVTLLSVR